MKLECWLLFNAIPNPRLKLKIQMSFVYIIVVAAQFQGRMPSTIGEGGSILFPNISGFVDWQRKERVVVREWPASVYTCSPICVSGVHAGLPVM